MRDRTRVKSACYLAGQGVLFYRCHSDLSARLPGSAMCSWEQIEMRRGVLDYNLAQDSFNEYLQYACPVDLARKDAEVCRTHPQYFIWPSDRFFIHYRLQ